MCTTRFKKKMLLFAHGMQVVILYDTHTNQLVEFYGGEAESTLQVQTERLCLD
jgi:hypothetical protein